MAEKKQAVILQILPELNAGGVERGTIEIARAINDAGYVSLVCSKGGYLEKELKRANTRHFTLDVSSKSYFKMRKAVKELRKIIVDEKVDIVHARSRVPAWIAYKAIKGRKCKFLTTFHGVYSGTSGLKKRYNAIMTKGDLVIAVSNFIKQHIKDNYNADEKRIRLIHRGVDLNYFDEDKVTINRLINCSTDWAIPEDKKVILMPGRISSWKGQELLIDALYKLGHKDYYCLIVGAAGKHKQFLKRLEQKIRDYDLDDNVAIHENTPDIVTLYKLADIVVCPSLRPEAFGRVVVEAGAMGVPVVATNHGGASETVIHGKTGLLINEFTAEELSAAIDKALNLPAETAGKIGDLAKKQVSENFSLEKMQKKTIDVYQELLEEKEQEEQQDADKENKDNDKL